VNFYHDEEMCGIGSLCNTNKYEPLSDYVCIEDSICKCIVIGGGGVLTEIIIKILLIFQFICSHAYERNIQSLLRFSSFQSHDIIASFKLQ
jgi:hypothetical protein